MEKNAFECLKLGESSKTVPKIPAKLKKVLHQCLKCGDRFKSLATLKRHSNIHSSERFECKKCGKKFLTKASLGHHFITHTGKQAYQCKDCDKRFVQKGSLTQHVLTHTTNRQFQCTECSKTFKKFGTFKRHKMTHPIGRKRYQCFECGKYFKRRYTLTHHEKNFHYNKETEYKCLECDQKFRKKHQLSEHILTHTKDIRYQCPQCGKPFNQRSALRKHEVIHSKEKIYQCSECHQIFKDENFLTKHLCFNLDKQQFDAVQYAGFLDNGVLLNNSLDIVQSSLKQDVSQNQDTNKKIEQKEQSEMDQLKVEMEEHPIEVIDKILIMELKEAKMIDLTADDVEAYREKLGIKEAFVQNQLTKLFSTFKSVYNESTITTEYESCQLDVSKQIPLYSRSKNFWKFICRQLSTEHADLTLRANSAKTNFSNEKKIKWILQPDDLDSKNDPSYPPFILDIIKVFEDFLQQLTILSREITFNLEYHKNEEWMDIIMQANSKDEVMVFVILYKTNHIPVIRNTLRNYLHSQPIIWNIKSLYYKSVSTNAILLYGVEKLYERVGHIQIEMSPNMIFSLNISSIEILAKTIDEYLAPNHQTTLLEIGCGNGLIGILLASKFKEVIGIDDLYAANLAYKVCDENNIKNFTFEKDKIKNIELLFEKIQHYDKVTTIVNHNGECGTSVSIMKYLQKLTPLNRLAVVTPFTDYCIPSLLRIMKPVNNFTNGPFILTHCCVVDTLPDKSDLQCVMLMERKEIFQDVIIVKEEPIDEINC